MRDSGFESVYLPLETMSRDVTRAWNRRHSHAGLFEGAVKVCQEANFRLHDMEVNAFILFGMPDEELRDVVNTMFYASEMVAVLCRCYLRRCLAPSCSNGPKSISSAKWVSIFTT